MDKPEEKKPTYDEFINKLTNKFTDKDENSPCVFQRDPIHAQILLLSDTLS